MDSEVEIARFRRLLAEAQLPEALKAGIERYVIGRVEPGHFLGSVLRNDLQSAVLYMGDGVDLAALVRWMHYNCPDRAWGSDAAVLAWTRDKPIVAVAGGVSC